ncbi:hypothetical protein ALC57_12287, partial [Trachymyrmex cornetzi]
RKRRQQRERERERDGKRGPRDSGSPWDAGTPSACEWKYKEREREKKRGKRARKARNKKKRKAKLGERHSSWSRNERRQPLENRSHVSYIVTITERDAYDQTLSPNAPLNSFTFSASEFHDNAKKQSIVK